MDVQRGTLRLFRIIPVVNDTNFIVMLDIGHLRIRQGWKAFHRNLSFEDA